MRKIKITTTTTIANPTPTPKATQYGQSGFVSKKSTHINHKLIKTNKNYINVIIISKITIDAPFFFWPYILISAQLRISSLS
jgi:hypothetical protein